MTVANPAWVQAVQQSLPTSLSRPSIAIVVDPNLLEHPVVEIAGQQLSQVAQELAVHPCPLGPGLGPVERSASIGSDHDLVVSVGGGSVIDMCSIGRIVATNDDNLKRLQHAGRSGVIQLYGGAAASALVCVPTTIGTGAEHAGVAVWDDGHARRLVSSPSLRADGVVYDARASASLTSDALGRGGLEILLRLAGTYVGASIPESPQDLVAEALTEEVARRLYRLIATDSDRLGHAAEEDRLALARLSAAAHSSMLVRSVQHIPIAWIVANEAGAELALPKMTVLPAVIPAVWSRILAGDARFGHAERLVRWWSTLADAWPLPLPVEPDRGVARLVEQLQLARTLSLTDAAADTIAHRVVRSWSLGLPFASDVRVEDVIDILNTTTTNQHTRKEVNHGEHARL